MRHSQEQGTDLAVRVPDRTTAGREGVRKHGVMTRLLLALWASLVSVELARGSVTREPRKGWTGLEWEWGPACAAHPPTHILDHSQKPELLPVLQGLPAPPV